MSDTQFLTVVQGQTGLALKRVPAVEAVPPSASPVEVGLSGPYAAASDVAGGRLFSDVTVEIEPMQTGTGDPSPSNVRPISGFTGAVIRHTGKNLWGGNALLGDIKTAIPTATVDNENRTVKYAAGSTATNPLCGEHDGMRRGFQFAENTQYTFIITMYRTGSSSNMRVYYTDGTYDNIPASSALETKGTVVFVSASGKSIKSLNKVHIGGYTTFYADESGIFEGVLTADDFEAYNGKEVTVTFPSEAGTVYGGMLDVTAGTLTVDKGIVEIDGTSGTYGVSTQGYHYISTLISVGSINNADLISDQYSKVSKGGVYDDSVRCINGNRIIIYDTDRFPDEATTRASLESNPVHVVFPLASPVTYQLTPVQIEALTGYNAVYTVCGPASVEYIRDTEAAISVGDADTRGMIAEASKVTASRNYTAGEFLTVGAVLYRVTAAIASGGTITPGVNVTATTVAEQLTALWAAVNS